MREKPVVIKIEEDNKKDRHDRYFDAPLFGQLENVRDGMLKLAQKRDTGIFERMSLLLGMAHDIERRIRKRQSRNKNGLINKIFPSFQEFTPGEVDEIKKIISSYSDVSAYNSMAKHIITEGISAKQAITDMLFTLCTMEPLKNTWIPYIQSVINIRTQMGEEEYIKCQKEFKEEITEIQLEQLLFYFVYLYCCSATYDRMLLAKIKMAVANTVIIRELWFMKWLEDDKMLTEDAQAELAHWFVREVENSDENIEQWDSLMQRNQRFSLEMMLDILMLLKGNED